MSLETRWHATPERGALLGLRVVVFCYRFVGRSAAKLLLFPIVAYFWLVATSARRASRAYLARVQAGRVGAGLVFRHFLEFGRSILDRVGFFLFDPSDFQITVVGREHLEAVPRTGRGALVLGSHLGSFDAMRLLAASESPLRVHMLVYTEHARRINRILSLTDSVSGLESVRVIPIVPGSQRHVWEARACVRRGEVVAVLADRLAPVAEPPGIPVRLLGDTVSLPEGPFRLATLLDCPVLAMTGLRVGERRYEVRVEALGLGREGDDAPRELAQRYAAHLEALCRRAPLQWFNFYDYWPIEPLR